MDFDDNLYDEFGNYIGPEVLIEEVPTETENIQLAMGLTSVKRELQEEIKGTLDNMDIEAKISTRIDEPIVKSSQVILHEDKKYYPSAEEIYGKGVETTVQDEDTQPLEKPIVQPVVRKYWDIKEDSIPCTVYDKDYLVELMNYPDNLRNVALVGALHSGKTVFMDMLLRQTHPEYSKFYESSLRYTDFRLDEQKRGVSLKLSLMSLLLQNLKEKNFLCHLFDTPGHVNFSDEVSAALRLVDGAVLFVDAIDGVTSSTTTLIDMIMRERLQMVVVINKVDRLILELGLPPDDAYLKLKHTINDINQTIIHSPHGLSDPPLLSPELGNVCFASGLMGWSFTLQSFAQMYSSHYQMSFDPILFSKKLWGDFYFDEASRKFLNVRPTEKSGSGNVVKRTFVQFILEPLYKIYSHVIGQDIPDLMEFLKKINVKLTKEELKSDIKPLLYTVLSRFHGPCNGFTEMITKFIPSPNNSPMKIENCYTGDLDSKEAKEMISCDSKGSLFVYITKLQHKTDCSGFDCVGRVMSGSLQNGATVKVLGELYTLEDEEDMSLQLVSGCALSVARYEIPLKQVSAGNIVLIKGIDSSISKTATLCSRAFDKPFIFRPLTFVAVPIIKIAVEPLHPSELPKMVDGLRKINKSYPLLSTKVEESGEHVIFGTGELYLDCAMHDLRNMYAGVEVKVSDPVVSFSETIFETSTIITYAETANKKNKLSLIAEPLERGLGESIEAGKVSLAWNKKKLGEFFGKYDWDVLQAHSIWAFGPENNGPNILLNETLPNETNPKLLQQCKDSIVRGFKWGTKEGPLCDEPVRNVKFRLVNAMISDDPLQRGSGQIIPAARRVVYSSFLVSTPRMMEPVLFIDVQTPLDCVKSIFNVLERRRGHVIADMPKPGSPLYNLHAYVPAIDSFGLETDIRAHTQGMAFCESTFHHWSIVPGDPLDKTIVLRPLEPSPPMYLAREFMVKTRRRKGLPEDVHLSKFIDEPLLLEMVTKPETKEQLSEQLLKYT